MKFYLFLKYYTYFKKYFFQYSSFSFFISRNYNIKILIIKFENEQYILQLFIIFHFPLFHYCYYFNGYPLEFLFLFPILMAKATHVLPTKFCNTIIMNCIVLSQHKRKYCKAELLTHYKE